MTGRTYTRESADGFELVLDGVKVDSTFNSRGAARAAIDVERRRRAKRSRYHENQSFEPYDRSRPNTCRHCLQDMNDHYNGRCPKED